MEKDSWYKAHNDALLEAIGRMENCVMTENEALAITTQLEKDVRGEFGISPRAFFGLSALAQFAVDVENRFGENAKILENVISILHHSLTRAQNPETALIYGFMFKLKDTKIKRGKWLIADTLCSLPEFENYDKKWEYIMSIPKIAPYRTSINIFRWTLEKRVKQIPDELKPQIIAVFDKFIAKFSPYKCDKCRMFTLTVALGDKRENYGCEGRASCYKA